jgi:hypothetical protein
MNKLLYGFAICILTQGCSLPVKDDVKLLLQKFDSINQHLVELKKQLNEKDSINAIRLAKADSIINDVAKQGNNPVSPAIKVQPLPPPVTPVHLKPPPNPRDIKGENETAIYYYKGTSKRVSVEITPWVNGRRKIKFYDPFGKITYACDDVRLSFSSVTELKKFHDNGAASQIEIHDNPGASMYWYTMTISFGINNEPQWKTVNKHPQESLEGSMNNKYWWNDKTGQWVKQEVVQEQPYTH